MKMLQAVFIIKYFGAVAQLGERMTGSHKVRGSIPLSSIKQHCISTDDINNSNLIQIHFFRIN